MTHPTTWTDEDILAALRECADERDYLSKRRYIRIRPTVTLPDGRTPPNPTTAELRFGSWGRAVKRAGLTHGPRGGPSPIPKWTDQHIINQLEKYLRWCGTTEEVPCVYGYEAWSKDSADRPSRSVVVDRFGWTVAVTKAMKQLVNRIR